MMDGVVLVRVVVVDSVAVVSREVVVPLREWVVVVAFER